MNSSPIPPPPCGTLLNVRWPSCAGCSHVLVSVKRRNYITLACCEQLLVQTCLDIIEVPGGEGLVPDCNPVPHLYLVCGRRSGGVKEGVGVIQWPGYNMISCAIYKNISPRLICSQIVHLVHHNLTISPDNSAGTCPWYQPALNTTVLLPSVDRGRRGVVLVVAGVARREQGQKTQGQKWQHSNYNLQD